MLRQQRVERALFNHLPLVVAGIREVLEERCAAGAVVLHLAPQVERMLRDAYAREVTPVGDVLRFLGEDAESSPRSLAALGFLNALQARLSEVLEAVADLSNLEEAKLWAWVERRCFAPRMMLDFRHLAVVAETPRIDEIELMEAIMGKDRTELATIRAGVVERGATQNNFGFDLVCQLLAGEPVRTGLQRIWRTDSIKRAVAIRDRLQTLPIEERQRFPGHAVMLHLAEFTLERLRLRVTAETARRR
ncbi:hypothetical protein DND132_2484 [Pseudodesulfovibrio mercurii]|uniref:Uncharacterized protein n=1 Tax=Pseudodesulfovibrio mercurii TaxID=641491 RepID=F0JCK7_9BACT|nr:hypothetical protein [Pseudodesulfovibrio mercurii]EGB15687.1 hypothetical protein DND132_2484 [Pseudodesulfovibrio mercurii]